MDLYLHSHYFFLGGEKDDVSDLKGVPHEIEHYCNHDSLCCEHLLSGCIDMAHLF